VRFIPRLPFLSSFWALIALMVAGTVAPTSCSRAPQFDMNSVAGVYSYFPLQGKLLILQVDGRASVSSRFFPSPPTLDSIVGLPDLEARKTALESMQSSYSETEGILEFKGTWNLTPDGLLTVQVPIEKIWRGIFNHPNSYQVHQVDDDILLLPIGTEISPLRTYLELGLVKRPMTVRRQRANQIALREWGTAKMEELGKEIPE
jgi:hypothetical protein